MIFLNTQNGKKGFVTTFSGSHATISQNSMPYAEGHVHGQHYWIVMQMNTPSIHAAHTTVPIKTLHSWLGHLSWLALQQLKNHTLPPAIFFQHAKDAC